MKRKLVSMSLLALMIISIIFAGISLVTAATGNLAFYASPAQSSTGLGNWEKVHWKSDALPGGYPNFDLKINISGVTNLMGVVLSVEWDPSILQVNTFTAGDFIPVGLPPPDATTGWAGNVPDNINGWISEAANTFLSGSGPRSGSGWICTLEFQFIGSPPSPGIDVQTFINITMDVSGRDTLWTDTVPQIIDFVQLDSPNVHTCEFFYEAALLTLRAPVADFSILTGTPIYEGTSVDFDASASVGGCDGDTDPTPITQYWWSFEGEPAALGTVTPSHVYSTAGNYLVQLYVVAPGVGPYIDPAYVDTSATVSKPISIKVLAGTGIDVFTDDYRWPGYTAASNGTGPGEPADAFMPQEQIDLYAYVFYNDDLVQNKLVKFHIEGPMPSNPADQFIFTRTAFSSNGTVWNGTHWIPMPEGVAWIQFRIPWTCENAEERVFGKWTVTVQVALPDILPGEEIVYEDSMQFAVGWIVEITSVETLDPTNDLPKDVFKKCETIKVEVTMTCISMNDRDAYVAVTVYDDVGMPIGSAHVLVTVTGEPTFCNPVTTTVTVTMHVPKWAYVGAHGIVYANIYTDWPWIPSSAVPWGPEASHVIEIAKA